MAKQITRKTNGHWLTVPQIAELLNTTKERIWDAIHRHDLEAVDISPPGCKRPSWRISPEALERWLTARTNRPQQPKPRRRRRKPEAVTEYY